MFFLDSEGVVSNSLGDWSALSDGNHITNSSSVEHWGQVSWQVVMSLLESIVFLNVMKVISSENDGS